MLHLAKELEGRDGGKGKGVRGGFTTCLVNGDSVDIGVIHKPDDLIGEEFSIVL